MSGCIARDNPDPGCERCHKAADLNADQIRRLGGLSPQQLAGLPLSLGELRATMGWAEYRRTYRRKEN